MPTCEATGIIAVIGETGTGVESVGVSVESCVPNHECTHIWFELSV